MIAIRDLETRKDVKGGSPRTPTPPVTVRQLQQIAKETYWHKFVTGFNVGHVLIILGMFGTAIWWFVNYDREITISKITVAQQVDLLRRLSDRVDGIDEHGTHFSQSGITKDVSLSLQNADRISKLEQRNADLMPRVERMDANLQNILEWVKEQKAKQ